MHPDGGGGLLSALSPAAVEAGTHPYAVAVSPDGKNVYVGNYGSASLSQFARDPQTGQLEPLSPATVPAQTEPHSVAVSADGKDVYAVNAGSDTVSQYARDPRTGALTALSPETVATGAVPRSIAISPDGKSAYVANTGDTEGSEAAVSQYARNPSTGTLTALSPATVQAGYNPRFVTVSGDGRSVYVASYGSEAVTGFVRNPTTGGLSAQRTYETPGNPFSIAVSGDDKNVYVADYSTGAISQFARSASTGLLTPLDPATVAAGTEPHSVVVSADGRNVYATNATPEGTLSQYARNTMTGALTAIAAGTIEVGSEPTAIALSSDGRSAYVTNHRSTTVALFERAQAAEPGDGLPALTDVFTMGRRVVLDGRANPSLAGRDVRMIFAGRRQVAIAKVGADGSFRATAPLPPASERNGNGARYSAKIGELASPSVKLSRRLVVVPPAISHRTVTLTGRVLPPLTQPVAPVVVWQQVACSRESAVAQARPSASGSYKIRLPAPAGATAALYRVTTTVRSTAGHVEFKTFSLQQLLQLP
jgi:6-phosphogluconolactonase (cycloisomerase 2 family)